MQGAVWGMVIGLVFTMSYIIYYKFINPDATLWFGISPEGIGTLGMLLNFVVAIVVSRFTPEPPEEVGEIVERIRYPRATFEVEGDEEQVVLEH